MDNKLKGKIYGDTKKKMPIPSPFTPYDFTKKNNPTPEDKAITLYKILFPGLSKAKK